MTTTHAETTDYPGANTLIQGGLWLAVFCAACGGFAGLGLLVGFPVSGWSAVLAALVACVIVRGRSAGAGRWLGAGILLASIWLAALLYDVSWDGQTYHQEAVDCLANQHWNPVWGSDPVSPQAKWISHYGKISWYYAAAIYRLTGRIETGKSINLAMALAAFLLCAGILLRRRVRTAIAVPLAAAAALNPVVSVQLFTFYVDGVLASACLVLLAGFWLLWGGRDGRTGWTAIGCGIVLLVNTKFTGLVIAAMLCLAFFMAMEMWRILQAKFSWRTFGRETAGFAAVFLLALAVGVNPYVTNTLQHGHPFYPLMGPDRRDVVTKNAPLELQGPELTAFQKGMLAHLSRSTEEKVPIGIKNPFSIRRKEFKAFLCPDARIGGFGPFFPACLVLGLVAFAWGMIRSGNRIRYWAGCCLLAVLASAWVNPEWWWARYVPQLWLIPLACGGWGLLMPGKDRGLRVLGGVVVAGMLAGAVASVFVSVALWNVPGTLKLHAQLARLRQAPGVEVAFDSKWPFRSNRLRLAEAGISFTMVEKLPESTERLVGSTTRVQSRAP